MNFLILILILCFFIFLFIVYFLSKDDFVILRNDVPMEKIFNSAFLFALSGLFFSRLFYVLAHPSSIFDSLLGFLLFPYFPGLSLSGGLLGGFTFSYVYFKSRNLPKERLLDFFSIALAGAFPVGLVGALILSHQKISLYFLLSIVLSLVYLFAFIRFVAPKALGSKIKDGSASLIFLSSFYFLYIITRVFINNLKFYPDAENILSILVFIASFCFLLKEEGFVKFLLDKWKNRK